VPTLFYSVDAHIHASWHKHYAGAFDKTLVAQRDYLEEYQAVHKSVEWFPLWPVELHDPNKIRDIPVSFRGTFIDDIHPKRRSFFDRLSQLVEGDFGSGPYGPVYSRSKIVVNQSLRKDCNFRVFEGMGCGALMLTPDIGRNLTELFTAGEEVVVYDDGDPDDAAQKIRWYLDHEEERLRIARNGFHRIQKEHSAQARAHRFINILKGLRSSPSETKRISSTLAFLLTVRAFPANEREMKVRYLIPAIQMVHRYIERKAPATPELLAVVTAIQEDCSQIGAQEHSEELLRKLVKTYPQVVHSAG